MIALTVFLNELAARRWAWGETDCLMPCADWIARVHGVDPAAAVRGTYADGEGCLRALRRAGGMARAIDEAVAQIGMGRTEAPDRGDIGLVIGRASFGGRLRQRQVGAICTQPGRWAVMTPDFGLVITEFVTFSVGWRV